MNAKARNLTGILLAMSLTGLTQTMVATAMPSITAELGGGELYSWVFGAYLLAISAPMLLYGKLADEMGWRPVLIAGIALFLTGTGLAGTSLTMGQLVAYRVLQGVGAGLLSTSVLAAVGALFEGKERARLFGYLGTVQVLANLAGPLLGGWITDTAGWRWCFWLVLPFGLAVASLQLSGLRSEGRVPLGRLRGLDWPVFAALSAGPAVLLAGIQAWRNHPETWELWLLLIAASVLFMGWQFSRQSAKEEPVLPPAVFRHPVLRNVLLGACMAGLIQNASISYIPYVAQAVFGGGSATRSGLILFPVVLGAGVSGIVGGRLAGKWTYVRIAAFGWSVNAAGFFLLAYQLGDARQPLMIAASLLIGLGIGFQLPSLLLEAQDALGPAMRGMAGGLIQMARNLGGATGIPLLGAWLPSAAGVYSLTASASLLYTMAAIAGVSLAASRVLGTAGKRRDEDAGRSGQGGQTMKEG
ncbi:MFS transporter [Paenibacillus spiritus]|uniref:MFS transporter n=1 Tax=Paenibacillus spiritus TaxID=2496557 RepID=A0A5J5G3C5_9BACL|nr:MFS transporter [Paenibacillus spiritus]KAA9001607.1 MFS transporter [Paenibacillus spiritus]